jgi:hypothetical protein
MTSAQFHRILRLFPDEATLLECLRQIGRRPGMWEEHLGHSLAEPDFTLEGYFCEQPEDGPYLNGFRIAQDRSHLSFDYGECWGGCAGEGNRYVFRLPGYLLDEEATCDGGWIH